MTDKLLTLINAGRVPHALVIDGGTYESRLACAKEVAAALLGESQKVMADIHPDVITVLPEEKKKTLSVELIRKMRDDVYVIPNENERKVYIIGKAELMQDYAQNALLKILEEPPRYATFILLCDTHSALLGTVLSRVAVFTLDEEKSDGTDETYETCLSLAKDLAAKTAARDGFINGRVIWKKVRYSPAPSILAASISSSGIELAMKVRRMMTFIVVTQMGKISSRRLSFKW